MKIKSIAQICKKNKTLCVFSRQGDWNTVEQYISDGCAVYSLQDFPDLDVNAAFSIFDIPEKQRDSWRTCAKPIFDNRDFADVLSSDEPLEDMGVQIAYQDKILKCLKCKDEVILIESRYISPLSDVLDILQLCRRKTAAGSPYVVAKAGFLLQAVICPVNANKELIRILKDLTVCLENAEEVKFTDYSVNKETGEIIENSEDE